MLLSLPPTWEVALVVMVTLLLRDRVILLVAKEVTLEVHAPIGTVVTGLTTDTVLLDWAREVGRASEEIGRAREEVGKASDDVGRVSCNWPCLIINCSPDILGDVDL